MDNNPNSKLMTLDALRRTVEFRQLRPRQAKWVTVYVQSYLDTGIFHSLAATKAAYNDKLAANASSHGSRLKAHPKIQAVVQLFLTTRVRDIDVDLAEIQKHLDACVPGSVASQRLLSLKHSLKLGIKSEPEEPEFTPRMDCGNLDTPKPATDSRVPDSALKVWLGADGACVGYRDTNGTDVKF